MLILIRLVQTGQGLESATRYGYWNERVWFLFFTSKADDMKRVQGGFTLIELVMVIVILGV